MFEDETEQLIKQRLLDAVPSDLEKREGSFIYDAISPAAIELALAYIELDRVLQLGFAETTYGTYLDYRAHEYGVTRKAATAATGQVTITGSQGTLVPSGSLFATGAGNQFKTSHEVTIGETGSVDADIVAVNAGASGNIPSNIITEIPVAIPGVVSVTNPAPTTGGTDQEADAELLERLLDKVRNPATSGNSAHYLQWAKEIPGIGDAKVFPLWDGPGTVKVVVIDSNKQPANTELIENVSTHIEEVRPIGAAVTCEAAAGLDVDVTASVTLEAGAMLSGVQGAFEEALGEYLKEIAFDQSYVSFAQIGVLLFDTPGVADYAGLIVNSGSGNVVIGDTQVAVLGTVILNE